jgi:integrase/recombinase XerD
MSTTGSGRAQRLLDDHIEPFLQHLRDAGYAERTLRKKRTVARAFAQWANRKGIALIDLNDSHVDAFVQRLPRAGKFRQEFELASVRLFLGYLRGAAGHQCPAAQAPVSSTASLVQQYENHLRNDRGLAENSVRVYLPLIHTLLASKLAGTGFPQSLKALTIRDFVIAQTRDRSAEYVRLLATALRSFCRFLFFFGYMPVDLSPSVPRVCKYRQSTPPAFLAPEEVTRALVAIGSINAQRTSGLCDPAPPCPAWFARRRDRSAGTGRYLLPHCRDRCPWEGPHDRALTPAA